MKYVETPARSRGALQPQICIFIVVILRILNSHISKSTEYIFVFVFLLLIKTPAVERELQIKLHLSGAPNENIV